MDTLCEIAVFSRGALQVRPALSYPDQAAQSIPSFTTSQVFNQSFQTRPTEHVTRIFRNFWGALGHLSEPFIPDSILQSPFFFYITTVIIFDQPQTSTIYIPLIIMILTTTPASQPCDQTPLCSRPSSTIA